MDEKVKKDLFDSLDNNIKRSRANFNNDFRLQTDASNTGIGAILCQENKVIGVFSRKLNSHEKNYTVLEKELFAVIKAMQRFKKIIFASTTIIETDNKNLCFLKKEFNSRMNRWKVLLNELNFEIKHIRGKENIPTDYISRTFCLAELKENKTLESLRSELYNLKEKFKRNYEEKGSSQKRYLVPDHEVEKLIWLCHNLTIYGGMSKLYETLKHVYEIKNFICHRILQ